MIAPTARTERRALPSQPTPRTATAPHKTDGYGNPISLIPERRENSANVEGPNVSVTARIGGTTVEIETRGAIGVKQLIPIPAVPGLGATGGLKINTTTGKIEQVSVGVSYINLVSVDVAIAGCNVIITLSAGIPGTVTFIKTSQTHEIPNCKPEEPYEPSEEIPEPEPLRAPSPDYPGLDPYDPTTFPALPVNCSYIISLSWPYRANRRSVKLEGWELESYPGMYCGINKREFYIQGYSYYLPANMAERILFGKYPEFFVLNYRYNYKNELLEIFTIVTGLPGVPRYTYHTRDYREYNKECSNIDEITSITTYYGQYPYQIYYSNQFQWITYYLYNSVVVVSSAYLKQWREQVFEKWKNLIYGPAYNYLTREKVIPKIMGVASTCDLLPGDKPKEPKLPTPSNNPGFQPTKRKMDECCKALGRQIEEIHAALSADKFPHEIPQYLSNRGGNVKIENYWQGLIDLQLKLDDLIGEFPVKIKVTTDEGQEKEEELVTVADALADIYQLGVATYYDADNVFSLCIKLITLLVEMRAIAQQTYDISYITNEQLGFEIERKPTKIELPIDPRYPDDWDKFNKPWIPDAPNAFKWENRDDATVKAYFLELTKLAVTAATGVSIKGKPDDIVERVTKMSELLRTMINAPEIDDWFLRVKTLSREETPSTPRENASNWSK